MAKGWFIAGTDTGVGKTAVACMIAACLKRRGLDVGVMKPIATGGHTAQSGLVSEDALALAAVAGVEDPYSLVNPVCYEAPVAPSVAARETGRPVDMAAVWRSFEALRERHATMIVEGIGGLLAPISDGFFVSDLARMIGLPLVIVARAGLGTINHTLLTLECARARGLTVLGIILNGARGGDADPSEKGNAGEIARLGGARILGTVEWRATLRLSGDAQSELADIAENQIAVSALLAGSADC